MSANNWDSDFEPDYEKQAKRLKASDLNERTKKKQIQLPSKSEVFSEYNRSEGRIHRQELISLDVYSRHKMLINHYLTFCGRSMKDFKRDSSKDKTDMDVIQENHQFLWEEDDTDGSWEKEMAKKYYDKLFKEYCIGDLSRYKENKIALRWRIEKEVVEGKGQFICGNKKCNKKETLKSWEVNFGYMEHGEKKNALVKIRLCMDCSYKLNYHHKKREIKRKKKEAKKNKDLYLSNDPNGECSGETVAANNSKSNQNETTDKDKASEVQHWSGPAPKLDEKSREEEFEEYFEDMFL